MDDKPFTGFGYCSFDGHKHVKIYKTDKGFVLEMDFIRSLPFKHLDVDGGMWEALAEVEDTLKLIKS
jgi:hypothetical protein